MVKRIILVALLVSMAVLTEAGPGLNNRRKAFRAVSGSPGTTDLVSWWELEEASGTRTDSYGANDLTEVNSVGQTTGVQNNAANFPDSENRLYVTNNASLTFGSDTSFTVGLWFKPVTTSGLRIILLKHNNFISAHTSEFQIYRNGTGVTVNVGNGTLSGDATVSPIVAGSWHFIVAWHDGVNNEVGLMMNIVGGSNYETVNTWTGGTQNVGYSFNIGSPFGAWHLDGAVDEVFFYKDRVLTSDERDWLWNSGSGRSFGDL